LADEAVEKSGQIEQKVKKTGGKVVKKAGKEIGKLLFKLLLPYLPIIIGVLVVILLVFGATSAIYAQLTTEHSDIQTEEGTNADEEIKAAVDKANARSQYDAYGRDAMLELTTGQVWAVLTFKNSAISEDISKQVIDETAEELKPIFKYRTEKRVVEQMQPIIDPETGEKTGEEWVAVSTSTENLLDSADTILGSYTYSYKKVTQTNGDIRVTYMQPYETKQIGEPYARLKKYLDEKFNLVDNDIDIAVQAVLEASAGFETDQERMTWLMGYGGGYTPINYIGIPADIIPAIQEASKKFGIPEWLIAAVIKIESNFNPLARNATTGAYGLMQIMPFHIEGGLFERLGFDREADRDNPRAQVIAGMSLLKSHIGDISVDWQTDAWKQQTLKGLANYGGYTDDRLAEAEAEYVSKIWEAADMYKRSGINTGMIWPVPGYTRISSYFGGRADPITGKEANHSGIDIPAPTGTTVVAASSGTVVFAGWSNSYGNLVVIESGMYNVLYGHNSSLLVSEGQTVQQGQPIAEVGSTGRSTGPHLHFGISVGAWTNGRWFDPLSQVSPY
jgi:tetrahydromethanopterin S-methyltransferase subunit G